MKKITIDIDDTNSLDGILNSQKFKEAEHIIIKGTSEEGLFKFVNINKTHFVKVLDLSKTCFLIQGYLFKNHLHQIDFLGNLREIILPENLEILKTGTIGLTYNLQKITFPKNLKKIEHHAIEAPKLKNATIPDTVEVIEDSAFSNCEKLTEINIPKNVKKLHSPFDWCFKVKQINLAPENPNFKIIKGAIFSPDGKKLICVPPALCENYKIPFGTEVLESGCFDSFAGKSVVIPESVKTIKQGTFKNCLKLETVLIPDSVVEMGYHSFMQCDKLKNLRLSEQIVNINEPFFYNCGNVKTITLPEKLEYIKSDILSDLYSLNKIIISPNNPNYSTYNGALYTKDMKRLIDIPRGKAEKLKLYEGVEVVSGGLFWAQETLKEFKFPDSVKIVETRFFDRCRKLEKITFGSQIEEISFDAFHDCDMLKTFVVPAEKPPKIIKQEKRSPLDHVAFWVEFDFKRMTVYVPKNAVEKYRNADFWKDAEIKEME